MNQPTLEPTQPHNVHRTTSAELFERTMSKGWSTFISGWGWMLLATVAVTVSIGVGMILSWAWQGLEYYLAVSGTFANQRPLVWIAYFVSITICAAAIQWPVQSGALMLALDTARNAANRDRPRLGVDALFIGYRRYLAVIASYFLFMCCMVGAMLPGALLGGIGWFMSRTLYEAGRWSAPSAPWSALEIAGLPIMALGGCVAFAASIYINARLFVFPMRAIDPMLEPLKPIAALRATWAATHGRVWSSIGLFLIATAAASMSVFLCCIGIVLVGMPFQLALQAAFYRELFDPDDAVPPQPWLGEHPPRIPV